MGSFSETEGGKEALPESRQSFEVAAARTFGLVNVVFSRQTGFFECEHSFKDKLMVTTAVSYTHLTLPTIYSV